MQSKAADDWVRWLMRRAEQHWGEARAAELAGEVESTARAIAAVLAEPLEPADQAPNLIARAAAAPRAEVAP